MSHNASGALCPYITSHTTALSTAGAGQTLTITGFGLSLATTVDIPAALGVETARSYTKASATSGTLTITLTVESLPDPVASRSIAISQGGVPAQGPYVTSGMITVNHGWSPSLLNPALWFDADDNTTFGYSLGKIISWTDKSSNAVVGEQPDASKQPLRAVRSEFSGGTASGHVFVANPGGVRLPGAFPAIVDSNNQFTHFIVLSLYDQNANLMRLGSGGFTPVWKLNGRDGPAIHHDTNSGDTGGVRTTVPTASYLGDNVAHMVTVIGDASAGYSTRLNGAVVDAPDSDTLQAVQPAANDVPTVFSLRGYIGGAHYAEIIHIPRLCTASEITQAEAYLNAKWGVYS